MPDKLVLPIAGGCPKCREPNVTVPEDYNDDTIISCSKCGHTARWADFFRMENAQMPQGKEVKTEAELRAMILSELQKHPECKNVTGVAFTRPSGRNWDVSYIRSGSRSGDADRLVGEFVRHLQSKYDLA